MNTPSEHIRLPAVAGSFYPSDEKILKTDISQYLNQAKLATTSGLLKILIVPHAGISYSGHTAAWGFKQLEGQNFSRVIILGASHTAQFDHAAVYTKGSWQTPFGKVPVDENLALALIDKEQNIIADEVPHQDEHSLEIELIFLQRVLSDFKIVPVLISSPSDQLIDNLAQKISEHLDENTLLVISSDLSHYPEYEIANKVDNETIKAILTGKKEQFVKTIQNLESKAYPNLATCACGQEAIKVALKVWEFQNLTDFKLLKYENSGDTGPDKSQVVGYASIGVWGPRSKPDNIVHLDEKAREEALQVARRTIEEYVTKKQKPDITPKENSLMQNLGAFVTIRKEGQLRGCIGRFEPNIPLFQVIQEMTIEAASKDLRFLPVKIDELKDIKIEISVMTPKKKISNWQEIELGKHGVVVQGGGRAGTFLPQVVQDTGWTKEEFLSKLCSQKAGLPSDCYKDPDVNLYTFEAQIFEEK